LNNGLLKLYYGYPNIFSQSGLPGVTSKPKLFHRVFHKEATNPGNIYKPGSAHTFRYSFATHLLKNNYDIRAIQKLPVHNSLKITMVYSHIANLDTRNKNPLNKIKFHYNVLKY